MDGMDKERHRCSLWHHVAGDVGVLIQHPPHRTHRREQPHALLDAVLEVQKTFNIIAEYAKYVLVNVWLCTANGVIPVNVFIIFIFLTKNGVHLLTTFLLMFRMDGQVVESPSDT